MRRDARQVEGQPRIRPVRGAHLHMALRTVSTLRSRTLLPIAAVSLGLLHAPADALAKRKQPAAASQTEQTTRGSASPPAQATPAPTPAPTAGDGGANSTAPSPAAAPSPPAQWTAAEIEAALKECVTLLAAIKATVEPLPAMRAGECGTPAPVLLRAVGTSTSVEISPPAIVNCRVVAQLHRWVESSLQPTASIHLKSPVTRIQNASGYVCRNRIGSSTARLSEHATANAIDISAITTADGRRIDVSEGWGAISQAPHAQTPKDRPPAKAAEVSPPSPAPEASKSKPEAGKRATNVKPSPPSGLGGPRGNTGGSASEKSNHVAGGSALPALPTPSSPDTAGQRFLHALHTGACGTFTTVLGPEANDAHKGHLHFDLATRRGKAYCQ